MRQLTLEERINMFKFLAVSKVIHLLLITKLHKNKIRKTIKRSTLYNGYEKEGLKNVDFRNKITNIQCS